MNPKVWLAVAGAAILALVFWAGKLQERSVGAPAVAAAQAKYDALEGERKSLAMAWSTSTAELVQVKRELQESQSKRVDDEKTARLLGVTPAGKPIIGYDTHHHEENARARHEDIATSTTKTAETARSSDLVANRQAWHLGYLALGWQASQWDSLQGWKDGVPTVAAGINVPVVKTLITGRKAFDGTDKIQAEAGWTW